MNQETLNHVNYGQAEVDPLEIYLKDISRKPLLSPEEEVLLAKIYERGKRAQEKVANYEDGDPRRKRLMKVIEKGQKARNELIERNLRLVVSIVKKSRRILPPQDLIQEGNLGLFRAVDKFDYRRGFKLSTYAHWWIRQAIGRAIAEQSRTIRVPMHVVEAFSRMDRAYAKIEQEFGREPTLEEIALANGISVERVNELMAVRQGTLSLETTFVGEEGDEVKLEDMVPGPDQPADEAVGRVSEHELFDILAENLTDREYQVLVIRYKDGKSLKDTSETLGLSRERIRQIEIKALGKLRGCGILSRLKKFISDEPLGIYHRLNYTSSDPVLSFLLSRENYS